MQELASAAGRDRQRLGRRIVEAREAAGLTQRVLAERLVRRKRNGTSEGTGDWHRQVVSMQRNLRRYENGHNVPGGTVLIGIAEETGQELAHFTADDDEDDSEQAMRRIAADLVMRGQDDLAVDLLHVAARLRDKQEPAALPLMARDGLPTKGSVGHG